MFAEDEAKLILTQARSQTELDAMIKKRVAGEPLEYVIGWAEFCGLRIAVGPGAFVPRRRTEFLAKKAIALIHAGSIVVDLGCGAGALTATVAAKHTDIKLYASDIDPAELVWARKNLAGSRAEVLEGDLFDPLPVAIRGKVDVLIANMPYVPTAAIPSLPTEAHKYESKVALDGGHDGLDLHRRVAAEAPKWLASGGHLLIETSENQAPVAKAVFEKYGLRAQVVQSRKYNATLVMGINP